jgi:hypothetical protein
MTLQPLYTYSKIFTVTKQIREMFRMLQLHFPKASILNLVDLPKLCVDAAIF